MRIEAERNTIQRLQERVGGFILETCLTQAVYWGKPNWTAQIGSRMNLPESDKAELIAAAYGSAADREEIIHGNHTRASELRAKGLQILLPYDHLLQ